MKLSFAALVLVTGIGPLATDTYIAALPGVQRSLHTSGSAAQLTITTFIFGLAAGQLLCGPLSDSLGRRPMLLTSSVLFAALSACCAVAPTAGLLLIARALEGLAGGCGVAVGRAVVSDRFQGADAAQRYGTLAAITLLAPVVAAGMAAASATFRFTVRRFGPARLRAVGLIASTAAATILAAYALAAGPDVGLAPTWVLLAVTVAGMGLCIPATTAIAQEAGRRMGGTASALQGGLTFGVGAAATPLTGLIGGQSVPGMAFIMSVGFLCAVTALLASSRQRAVMAPPLD